MNMLVVRIMTMIMLVVIKKTRQVEYARTWPAQPLRELREVAERFGNYVFTLVRLCGHVGMWQVG